MAEDPKPLVISVRDEEGRELAPQPGEEPNEFHHYGVLKSMLRDAADAIEQGEDWVPIVHAASLAAVVAGASYEKIQTEQAILTYVPETAHVAQPVIRSPALLNGIAPRPQTVTVRVPIVFDMSVYYYAAASSCLVCFNILPGMVDVGPQRPPLSPPPRLVAALTKGWARVFVCAKDAIQSNVELHAKELADVALALVEEVKKEDAAKKIVLAPGSLS